MSSGGYGPGQDWRQGQDDQRRRQAALRSLAQQGRLPRDANGLITTQPRLRAAPPPERRNPQRRNPQSFRAAVQRPQPPRRRRALLITVIALVVVALVAGVVALKSGRLGRTGGAASAPVMPAVRTIDLSAYNISCPKDPIWSPDGTQIAVLATLGDCQNPQTAGPTLAVFDTRTGKLTQSYTLNTILAKQGIPIALLPSPAVWTPDGSALYVAVGYVQYQNVSAGTPHGLISIMLASGAVKFIADTSPPLPPSQEGSMLDGATTIWDIKAGKLAHTIAELTPANAYAWSADGLLGPAPAGAMGRGVVSVWQSGRISPVFAAAWEKQIDPPADETVPQTYIFESSAPRWSPDGRYLALPLSMAARLAGGPNAYPTVGCAQVCQSAPVASPNKGFSAASAAFQKGWSPTSQQPPEWNSQDIAWRADGQELATMLPGQDFNTGNATATVTIYSAQSGEVVKTLAVNRVVVNTSGSGELPQITWSPRDASLAALNFADATLTLWRAE